MNVSCLDLEGVLIPEMWIEVAENTGIADLRLTTRDIDDYDELMQHRISVLAKSGVTIADIQEITRKTQPLDGAEEFLLNLRSATQVAILSDTFSQFVGPVMQRLSYPFLLCNELIVDKAGMITGYRMRQEHGKLRAVEAFSMLNLEVAAAGDSFNDIAMLRAADRSVLFRPSKTVTSKHPDLPVATTYADLFRFLVT